MLCRPQSPPKRDECLRQLTNLGMPPAWWPRSSLTRPLHSTTLARWSGKVQLQRSPSTQRQIVIARARHSAAQCVHLSGWSPTARGRTNKRTLRSTRSRRAQHGAAPGPPRAQLATPPPAPPRRPPPPAAPPAPAPRRRRSLAGAGGRADRPPPPRQRRARRWRGLMPPRPRPRPRPHLPSPASSPLSQPQGPGWRPGLGEGVPVACL